MLHLTLLCIVAETRSPFKCVLHMYNYIYVYVIQLKIHNSTYTITSPRKSACLFTKRFTDKAIYLHSATMVKLRLSIFRQSESNQDD